MDNLWITFFGLWITCGKLRKFLINFLAIFSPARLFLDQKPLASVIPESKTFEKKFFNNEKKGKKMRTLELFSGTKSFSKVAKDRGHSILTIDMDKDLEPDICSDMLCLDIDIIPDVDMIWASPPCEAFSVAAIGKNWNIDKTPKHARAELGMKLVIKTIEIIERKKPKFWFIENPRGMLRTMPFMDLIRLGGGDIRSHIANTVTLG